MELARQAFLYDDPSDADFEPLTDGPRRHQSSPEHVPHRHYIPLPPSPLGLSNYDAFDEEEYPHAEGEHDDANAKSVYSDFNVLEPSEPIVDDYDYLGPSDSGPTVRRPPTPPCEKIVELMVERERQREVSFVQVGL